MGLTDVEYAERWIRKTIDGEALMSGRVDLDLSGSGAVIAWVTQFEVVDVEDAELPWYRRPAGAQFDLSLNNLGSGAQRLRQFDHQDFV